MDSQANRKVGIIDLLQHVGESNVTVQFLGQCTTGIEKIGRGRVEVSFETTPNLIAPEDYLANKQRNVGVILWLPGDEVDRAKKELGIP